VVSKAEITRAEMPPQPANHGTGHGLLGVLPASSLPSAVSQAAISQTNAFQANTSQANTSQAMASADAGSRPQTVQQNGAIRPVVHTGWIIQVGALESEGEARQRLDAARDQARGLLGKADPFTEPVVSKGDKKLYRARFAGLDRDQAEAVCRALKRSEISCIAIRN
jgi:D-alanyl-D-alanine carboxypeptidase